MCPRTLQVAFAFLLDKMSRVLPTPGSLDQGGYFAYSYLCFISQAAIFISPLKTGTTLPSGVMLQLRATSQAECGERLAQENHRHTKLIVPCPHHEMYKGGVFSHRTRRPSPEVLHAICLHPGIVSLYPTCTFFVYRPTRYWTRQLPRFPDPVM